MGEKDRGNGERDKREIKDELEDEMNKRRNKEKGEGASKNDSEERNVYSRGGSSYTGSVTMCSEDRLNNREIDKIKKMLAGKKKEERR